MGDISTNPSFPIYSKENIKKPEPMTSPAAIKSLQLSWVEANGASKDVDSMEEDGPLAATVSLSDRNKVSVV